MNILLLGRGKTGSLVAETARHRGHDVRVLCAAENPGASALTTSQLESVEMVIDFTVPASVVQNIEACVRARKNIVVGTTGWYGELPRIRDLVEAARTGLLYASNFSIGVNLFFDIVRTGAAALQHEYRGEIFERHHAQKKDAPSGTAMAVQGIVRQVSGQEPEIVSFREGDVVGMHEVVLNSSHDTIYLCHDAKSRKGFAEGAVRAAEWLQGKKGMFDFKDVWRKL